MAFKWIWRQLKGYRLAMLAGLILVLVASMLAMVTPYVSGIIVDQVIQKKKTNLLTKLLFVIIGATFVKSIIRYSFQMIFETVSQSVLYDVRCAIYKKLQLLDFEFFDNNRTGDIMTKMTGDMDAVRHFLAFVIYNVFEKSTILLFTMIVLFSINVKFAMIVVAVTPITAFFTLRLSRKVKPAFFAIRAQFSRLNSTVQENISGNRVVKAFAKEDYETEKFVKENEAFRQRNIEAAKVWEKYLPILDSLAVVLTVIMILAGGIMVIKGSLSLGHLVTFNAYIWALNDPLRMAGWLINDIQRFAASAEKVIGLLETEPKIKNSVEPVTRERLKGFIEFKNVSFSYGDEEVLENINLKVYPGQTIAIIGPTGSGKSTLINLICRFYDCSSGEIMIDGMDIKDIEIGKLRDNIAAAMQDIFLFSDTIEGNIAYGVPDASSERIQWAASAAGAHDFICDLPEGYETIIGERGVGLSGGQKQRIALARALLKNPSILILDDTTSSVDMETEHKIHKTLNSIYKDKTTFIIAHRISSVKSADMILVLDNGKIIERGRHEELLKKKGYYFSVYVNQLGDFDNIYGAGVV